MLGVELLRLHVCGWPATRLAEAKRVKGGVESSFSLGPRREPTIHNCGDARDPAGWNDVTQSSSSETQPQ